MTRRKKLCLFNKTLFHWHKTHYRAMPWRNTRDPYRILVSEIMLQQTQVDRVRTKYVEFLKKFPHVRALAQASLGEVLRAWSGLGYNRRARYLHECAKEIVIRYHGKFPDDIDLLRALPGIGLSTAGALLAFAFGRDEPMIDTNIRRILTRTFLMSRRRLDSRLPRPRDHELYQFAKTLIPKRKGRKWNYAMLDLGATLCTARNHSPECPLMKLHGNVGDFQYKKPQKKFAGSNRSYRGRIVKMLTEKRALTPTQLSKALDLPAPDIRRLLNGLIREELIIFSRGRAALPN